MSIIFFDVEAWEEQHLPPTIGGQSITSVVDHVGGEALTNPEAIEVASVFTTSKIGPAELALLPKLKHIATRSTGFDHIDINACAEREISVSNVPEYGERTVAEHTFALILALSRKIVPTHSRTQRGNFNREGLRGIDLDGRTLGIVGCGRIGRRVAEIGRAFGMRVVAFDPAPDLVWAKKLSLTYAASLPELLTEADVVSLHVPLTDETKHMINLQTVQHFKPGAILVNTARGDLVQTAALLTALDEKRLSGVGLDVLEDERIIHEEAEFLRSGGGNSKQLATLLNNHILLNHPNVLITPHNAFNSEEAVQKILQTTVENIAAFLAGKPQNLISVR